MALTCSRCGTLNPDGNAFCQACGTHLAVVPPAPPVGPPQPIIGPPPDIPPPSYQSPYYAPVAGALQPPVHRTSWVLIVSAVVALVVIMAGGGTALAILNSRNANQTSSTGLAGVLPSPTPAGSPSPTQKGSPSPSSGGPGTDSNPTLSVTVPSGWLEANKTSETITLVDSNGYSLTIGSGPSNPTQTAQENKDQLDQFFTGKYPDTKVCPNTKVTTGSISDESGIFWQLCFTLTSGSQSVPAGAPLFAGANADGSVYYVVILLSPVSAMDSFILEARPVLTSIKWTLR